MWKKIFGRFIRHEQVAEPFGINHARLPRHVAIIMDGNGRWAKRKGLLRTVGHRAGVDALREILRTAGRVGIDVLTVYAFSTENWKRPHEEVDFLMQLFSEYLDKETQNMHDDNVRIRFLGRVGELSSVLVQKVHYAEKLMQNNTGVRFCVAVNYGGQDEICRAFQVLAEKIKDSKLLPADITPDLVSDALDTHGLPPVDLVIRTSGDMRVSNFLLWQTAYAEFWFTDTNWPEFTPQHFLAALRDYTKRERRFGGIKEK